MSRTSGPANKSEKAPTQYPILKKGRNLACSGCNNGKTYSGTCRACDGKGYIVVK